MLAGGYGCLLGIKPVFDKCRRFQAIHLAGSVYKLPETFSVCFRYRGRIQCRLDNRKILQLRRDIILSKLLFEKRKIHFGQTENFRRQLPLVDRIKPDKALYMTVIDQLELGLAVQVGYSFRIGLIVKLRNEGRWISELTIPEIRRRRKAVEYFSNLCIIGLSVSSRRVSFRINRCQKEGKNNRKSINMRNFHKQRLFWGHLQSSQ